MTKWRDLSASFIMTCFFSLSGAAMAQNTAPPPGAQTLDRLDAQSGQTVIQQRRPANTISGQLNANTVTIISGNPNGTYLFFAYDMAAVLDNGNDLRILPIVGKGAAQNTKDVLYLKGVDMGITQSDILSHFNKTGEMGANIAARMRYVTRLYNEEMHVLAAKQIKSIEQLRGKKVNFSDAGSGTQISSRLIFDALGIEVEEVNMGQADAFEAIKRGEIAATIAFGGKPTGAFSKLEAAPKKYHLIPVPYPSLLQKDYLPSLLTHEDYPRLIAKGEAVQTIAVGAVLAVFNWSSKSERYRRVAKFTEALFENFDAFLQKPRHPKWREVNLAAKLPGWRRFGAASEQLKKKAGKVGSTDPDKPVSGGGGQFPLNLSQNEREKLFRSFVKWRNTLQDR